MTERQTLLSQVESIMSDLENPGSCTTRAGHNRTSVFKLRPVLSQAMRNKGWEYSSKMLPGGVLLVRRWD